MILNPLEQFEIYEILRISLLSTGISITVIGLYVILSGLLVTGYLSISSTQLIPWMWTSSVESVLSGLLGMLKGKEEQYNVLIVVLFMSILSSNILGLIPYSFTATSHLIYCFSLSVAIMLGITILGISSHKTRFFSLFVPSGTPLALVPLLTIIELMSYSARAVSLGIRLGANMLSGHVLLKIISMFSWTIVSSSLIGGLIGIIPLVFLIALLTLELGIAVLQAYVFTLLTCSYIRDGVRLH